MLKEVIADLSALGGVPLYALTALMFLFIDRANVFIFLTLGFVLIYAITSIIRFFWFKRRPDKQKYKTWWQKIDASSFPSLHSARIVLLGLVMYFYFQNLSVLMLAIIAMIGVGYSRIWLNRHDWKDVLGGYILGAAVFFLIGML